MANSNGYKYPTNGNGNGNGYHVKMDFPGTVPDKLLPHSLEAEESLIGSIIVNPDSLIACDEIGLTGADFFIQRYGWIYDAAHSLGVACDIITLGDELARRGQLDDIGGQAELTGYISGSFSHTYAAHYARIIKRHSVCRALIAAAGDIARLGHNSGDSDPDEITQEASNILLKVSTGNQTSQPQPAEVYCGKFLDNLESYYKNTGSVIGIPTGLKDLDRYTGGLQPGKFILVAARPGMGKTSLVIQAAIRAAKLNRRVLFFSLEMLGEELMERVISSETGIDTDLMRSKKLSGDHWKLINQKTTEVSRLPLTIDDRTRTIDQIRARAINHQYRYGLDLVVIDYIQLIEAGRNFQNRDTEIGEIAKRLKAMANDLSIPVVVVSSLSRACESRADKHPMLSDLRESGALEYHADQVIFIYRDEIYNPDTQFPGVADVAIAKNRGGKTGMIQAFFKKHLTTFVDLEIRKK